MNKKIHDKARLTYGLKQEISPRDILFRQGECARKCYFISKGHLKLTALTPNGRQVIVHYIGTGDFAGIVPVLDQTTYPATAEAVAQTELTEWDRTQITRLLKETPDIVAKALHTTARHLEILRNRYVELCGEPAAQRIARAVMAFGNNAGSKTARGVRINITLSRQDIADYVGATVHTVSRVLSAWEKAGWLRSGREKITVTAPDMIGRIAEKNQ
ncbi:MAG: Crp/Fnr family transcriptional regulator [Desulfobacter sp.]